MNIKDVFQFASAAKTVFVIPFAITSIILFLSLNMLEKFRSKHIWSKLAIVFGSSHFILLIYWSIMIFLGMKQDYEFAMMWLTFIPVDFPISLSSIPIDRIVLDKLPSDFTNFILPCFIHVVLGSLQYSVWGYLIGKMIGKIPQRKPL